MPIREKSFRIGCGRYLQEAGVLETLAHETLRLGSAPMIVGGKTALCLTRDTIRKSLDTASVRYRIVEHTGTCNDEDAKALGELARTEGYDVIVGVGGGVIMDFAKMVSYFADLPLINVPTSSATCAAYTPLSVRYTKEGRTVGSFHHEREVDAVLSDTAIIAAQPTRLLLAGVFDAMAKFVEIKQRFNEDVKEYPIGLDYAYALSKHSYRELCEKTETALTDMQNGTLSDAVEQVIFTSVAATGVISGIARGSNQCALAHKFYEITRVLFNEEARDYLHGEIVGVGLLLQNHFNGECEKNEELLKLMQMHHMPHCASDVGVSLNEQAFSQYYDRLKNSSAINADDSDECARLEISLRYLWNLK